MSDTGLRAVRGKDPWRPPGRFGPETPVDSRSIAGKSDRRGPTRDLRRCGSWSCDRRSGLLDGAGEATGSNHPYCGLLSGVTLPSNEGRILTVVSIQWL